MPMLMALALFAQDTPLNAEAERALACAAAVGPASSREADGSLIKATAFFSYYVMVAGKADPGDVPYVDRVNAMTDLVKARPAPSQADARKQIAECDRAYPLARSLAPVRLPADPYQRDLTCFGSVMVMYGAAQGIKRLGEGDAELQWVTPAFEYYSAHLPDLMKQHGTPAANVGAEIDGAMKASLAIGNTYTITETCIAQLPKT